MKYNLIIVMKNKETINLIVNGKDIDNLQHAYDSIEENVQVIFWLNDIEINVKEIDYFMYNAEV